MDFCTGQRVLLFGFLRNNLDHILFRAQPYGSGYPLIRLQALGAGPVSAAIPGAGICGASIVS
jgi:hypothetical protein